MLLEALQNFEWYNEPANVVFRNEELRVTAQPNTDFWQSKHHSLGRDNGHFFFTRVDRNFGLTVKWCFEPNQPYSQCGIMLRVDENNWIKAAIIYDNPKRPMVGTSVTQGGYSDWAAQDISGDLSEIWFKIRRQQGDYALFYSLDGENYTQIRLTHLINDMPDVKVGAYICAPSPQPFEASLSQLELK